MKSRFGFLAVALLTNAARLCGQTIQSQLGVAGGLTVPTGAYHSGDLGGFKPGWQTMGLVTFRPDKIGGSVTALFIETRFVHVAGGLGYSCPLRTSCP